MSIIKNLQKTAAAVALSTLNGGDLADRLGERAIKAITNGMGSDEWKEYMALFCDTKEELAQLTLVRPATDKGYMPHMRAYIVSNAVCVAATGTRTANGVTEDIEPPAAAAVPENFDDPNVIRPFNINLPV
ncbi:MAG TPA: hypothetical protein VK421_21460 [Pyrinomonadaceae bacterium]|nr:hypothetical protein [Pyrinomonadaceae bacterium]